jgi:hypothetical protein
MTVMDDIIAAASEGSILRFTLSLWDLQHGNLTLTAEDEAVSILKVSKNTFTQYKEGKGSIGPEGWEKLAQKFDLRAYDIWTDAMRKRYRK